MTTVFGISAPLCVNPRGVLTRRGERGRETVVAPFFQIAAMPWFRFLKGMSAEAGRLRIGSAKTVRLVPVLLALAPGASLAQDKAEARDPATVCVQVEVAGTRAGHLDCAAATLQQAGRLAQDQARAAFDAPVVGVRSPDIAKGVANQTALRQRLGSNFGHSVHPQRPNRPTPPSRPSGRP